MHSKTSCRRAAATICPRPGLQRKRAAAALSQAGRRAGPDQPIRAIQPAGRTRRPPTGCTQQTSDVIQHHRLMPLDGGIKIAGPQDGHPACRKCTLPIRSFHSLHNVDRGILGPTGDVWETCGPSCTPRSTYSLSANHAYLKTLYSQQFSLGNWV